MRDNTKETLAREKQILVVCCLALDDQYWYDRLRRNIIKCKIEYYTGEALINDDIYDIVEARAIKIEKKHPEWVKGIFLSEIIGYPMDE